MRFYYYAIPGTGDQWVIHSAQEGVHSIHESKEAAMRAASARCRRHWEERGTPCGVRIRLDADTWEDRELYGPEAPTAELGHWRR
jgi:hypothetical protein